MRTNWPLRALGLLAVATVAIVWAAAPATVTWTAPTAYVDGTAMPAGDIDHYTLTWSPAGGTTAGPAGSVSVSSLSAVVPVGCGAVQFSVTATTTASAIYPNTTSTPAGPVPFASGVSCAPNPPGALAVH